MASPQEQPASQKRNRLLDTVTASQQTAPAGTVPNMIPRVAGASGENAINRLALFPELGIRGHGSHAGPSSFGSYPSGNTERFPDLGLSISPRHLELGYSPAMVSNAPRLSSDMISTGPAFCKNRAQAVNQPVLPQHVRGTPPVATAIQTTRIPSIPAGTKVSRLPSNNVPRKAPLQGSYRSTKSPSQNVSWKTPNPRQQRSTSRPDTPIETEPPMQKRRRSGADGNQSNVVQDAVVLHDAGDGKTATTNGRKRETEDRERVEVIRKFGGDEEENKIDTFETASSDRAHSGEERRVKCPRYRKVGTKRPVPVPSSCQPSRSQRRRPMYEYEVPLELEGIRKALGQDWDEYVYLMESLWLNKVTAHEFEQGAKALFRMDYDGMRKRMNSIMVTKMIMPRLEEIRHSLAR